MSDLWETSLEPTSTLADTVLDGISDLDGEELDHYESHLRRAFDAHPPPFGEDWYGEKFTRLARDIRWVAGALLANAVIEGEHAEKLWELAGATHNAIIAELIRQHAVDASRHSRMYVFLIKNLFPRAIPEQMRAQVNALSPGFTNNDHPTQTLPKATVRVLDELVQMNLGAIRTQKNQKLMAPVLRALCPHEIKVGVNVVLDRLLLDVTRHIEYTAKLIEEASRAGRAMLLGDLVAQRTREFNELTLDEIGEKPPAVSGCSDLSQARRRVTPVPIFRRTFSP